MYDEPEPLKRGQNLIDSMTSAQRQKFDAVVNQLKVEWAVSHGDLSPIIVEALCKRAALDMDVSAMTVGAKPTHNLRQVAKNIGDKEPFLQASIDARDAELKRALEHEVYDETASGTRMAMGHSGTWEAHVAEQVAKKMDQRASARFT